MSKAAVNQQGFVKLLISLTILFTVVVSILYINSNVKKSVSGDLIYPIKEISENLQLAMVELNYGKRAQILIDLTDNRAQEIKKMVDQKRSDNLSDVLSRLILTQKRVFDNIEKGRNQGYGMGEQLSNFEIKLKEQEEILESIQYEVRLEDSEKVRETMDITRENLERVTQMKARFGN